MKIKSFLIAIISLFSLSSCVNELEPYDNPFIYLSSKGASSASVSQIAQVAGEYTIHLSSKTLTEPLVIDYSITAGDGLTEGVDYRIITQGRQATIQPGLFEYNIRIMWLPHKLDATKDNTLTIKLESNSLNFTMGLPGPDSLQKELVIRKY